MASNGKDPEPGRGTLSHEEREALRQRASEIGQRLDEVRARKAPPSGDPKARGAALGQAFRILTELIVGVVVGGGIGWALDRQLGTGPWLLMLFLLLGFAAGLSNVVRTARQMQARSEPLQRGAPSVADDGDEDDDRDAGARKASDGKPPAGGKRN